MATYLLSSATICFKINLPQKCTPVIQCHFTLIHPKGSTDKNFSYPAVEVGCNTKLGSSTH